MKISPSILKAARRGNLNLIESAIAAGENVDSRDEDGHTPLMLACENGSLPAVQLLLQHGASVNARAERGESPLTLAVGCRHGEIACLLLERGAAPDIAPQYGRHPLAAAAAHDDWALCERLLSRGAGINFMPEGSSALSAAAFAGHEEIACRLIERGADVDCPAQGKHAPVVLAAGEGLLRLLSLILERTRQDHRAAIFTAAMAAAASEGREEVVDLLLARGCCPDFAGQSPAEEARHSPLCCATAQGEFAIVAKLLAHGAQVNATSSLDSALTVAARHACPEIVDLLLAHGADFTQTDSAQRSALDWALRNENLRIAESLFEAGAMPAPADLDAALLVAVLGGNPGHVSRLLDAGASPQAAFTAHGLPLAENKPPEKRRSRRHSFLDDLDHGDERAGSTALMLAAARGNLPLVELLLARGADLGARNRQGESALVFGADSGNFDVVSRLLAAGAEVDALSCEGESAMHAAAANAGPEMLELLYRYGGDIGRRDQNDWTPLLAALRNNRPATVHRLIELGADFRRPCSDGYTSLMAAARGACSEFLEPLVEGGVDINARWAETDHDALMIAAEKGLLAVVNKLLELGADPLAVNRDGETACSLARQAGHEAVWRRLAELGADPGPPPEAGQGAAPEACRRLVAQLQVCLPPFDAEPLLGSLPQNDDEVLWWLSDPLIEQNLWDYAEWKDYWGELPRLRVLEDIDMTAYDPEVLVQLQEEHAYPMAPEDVPYFQYQNHFLCKHGWRLLTLAEENLHMFCVRDDAEAIAKLAACLGEFHLHLVDHPPLTLNQCLEAFKEAMAEPGFLV